MDNKIYWDQFRTPPEWARKQIGGGRLKGMTDINPAWRLQAMTEVFGAVGIGWKYTLEKIWMEPGTEGQQAAFILISLYIKVDGEWSEPIPGIGGNAFIAKEKNGLYTSDECYKMALTDALSVAMKALGVGADIYSRNMDGSKYQATTPPPPTFEEVFKDILGPDLNAYLQHISDTSSSGISVDQLKQKALGNPARFKASYKAFSEPQTVPQGDDTPQADKTQETASQDVSGPKLGDDPAALRRFHAMITEKGYDPGLIKTAMRLHQVHPIGAPARYPFNCGSSKDILVSDLPAFKSWLDGLGPHHELFKALGMAPEDMEYNPYTLPHATAVKKLKEIRENETQAA